MLHLNPKNVIAIFDDSNFGTVGINERLRKSKELVILALLARHAVL